MRERGKDGKNKEEEREGRGDAKRRWKGRRERRREEDAGIR